jgi:hypothetical protein
MPWWKRDKDPRPAEEIDLDVEFARTRGQLLSALDELEEQVDRARFKEEARERQRQRRIQPGTA